jgi:hypothetical protein
MSNVADARSYGTTYYPSATDPAGAKEIEVTAGDVLEGIDVRLSKSPVAPIRGKVINQTGTTGRASVVLFPEALSTAAAIIIADGSGNFEIPEVAAGPYWLRAQLGLHRTRRFVELGGSPLENVELILDRGVDVTGTVSVENGASLPPLLNLRISLRPVPPSLLDGSFASPVPRTGPPARFAINAVPRDIYDFTLSGLDEGYFVKVARLADIDLLENSLDLASGSVGPIEIVLSPSAANLQGTVRDVMDAAVSGATVVLVPEGARRRQRSGWYRVVTSDLNGRFAISGVAPGEYKLVAWENIEPGAWMDSAVLQKIDASGERVDLDAAQSRTVALKVSGISP